MKKIFFITILFTFSALSLPASANSKTSGIAIQKTYEDYSLEKLRTLAEEGDPNAQYNLAERYDDGNGVDKNPTLAVKWAKRAAEQHNSGALVLLGSFYLHGIGVKRDVPKSFEYYKESAKLGNRVAIYNVGYCYIRGCAGGNNPKKAAALFEKAVKLGYIPALVRLGYAYDEGLGVKQDKKRAVELYHEAAIKGESFGQFNLSDLYYMGEGVEEDFVLSYMWRYVSFLNGYKGAMHMSDAHKYLLDNMSKKQVELAKALAEKCFKSQYKQCEKD